MTIWYDWHDDGPSNSTDLEHHFGLVFQNYTAKPAYHAVQTLTSILTGYQFSKRILFENSNSSSTQVLVFEKQSDCTQTVTVAWSSSLGKVVDISWKVVPQQCFKAVNHLGGIVAEKQCAKQDGTLQVTITDAPLYLVQLQRE